MKIITLILFLGLSLLAGEIEVTIVYGNGKPDKVVKTAYDEGTSALEVLRKVSDVETSQKGAYSFVRSIDGVRSVVGKFGWFYLIDGESVHKTAGNYLLKDAKTMTWVYKVEACY